VETLAETSGYFDHHLLSEGGGEAGVHLAEYNRPKNQQHLAGSPAAATPFAVVPGFDGEWYFSGTIQR
jgi:hypothetical protein